MQLSQNDQPTSSPQTTNSTEQNRDYLDAFTRVAVWGPIGLFSALGKEIPAPLKLIMIGSSILQIAYGLEDLKKTAQSDKKEQVMEGLRRKRVT